MRSKRQALLLCLFALVAFTYFAPTLLSVKQVQSTLIQQAEEAIGAEISMAKMRWRWGPLPHFTLIDSSIKNDAYEIILPKTRIYPDWRALLEGKVVIGRLYFRSPQVIVNQSFYHSTGEALPELPNANITVDDGSLILAPFANDLIQLKEQSFEHIQLKLRHRADHFSFTVNAKTSFAENFSINSNIFDNKRSHSSSLTFENFELDKLVDSAFDLIRPIPSIVDFSCDIIGEGSDTVSALFSGDLPDFSLQRLDKPAMLKFANANFLLQKNGKKYSTKIYELKLSEPASSFSGEIVRYFPAEPENPYYKLDLAAENVDLTNVRSKLLTLLGDNSITRTVCNIVRSGSAKSATYTFDAPLSNFGVLTAMVINVDVDNAQIHVPGVKLDLDRATGPIIIKNGSLYGYNITTWLDNNYGSNGSFAVGLSEDNWLFNLDLDIDADLTTLPQTLHYLINNSNFRREVLKFSAKGRKNGHLSIGDDLHDFIVNVQIDDLAGSEITYERISWPITFRSGALSVVGDIAEWRNVSAIVGPHDINQVSGSVSWANDYVPLHLHFLDALFNAEELYKELNRFPVINEYLAEDVSSVSGIIAGKNGSLFGPFFDPSQWLYKLNSGMDITFTTPHLPGSVKVNKANIKLDERKIELQDCFVDFLESPLIFSADLNHSYFSDWNGEIILNGEISPVQGNWLKEKEWIHQDFFPNIPINLKNFKIKWHDEDVSIFGTLENKLLTGDAVEAVFEAEIVKSRHEMTSLHFFSNRDDGRIILKGEPAEEISWKGNIDKHSVAAILSNQMIIDGDIEGNFTLSLPSNSARSFKFTGDATIRDLQWIWGDLLRQITIPWLSVHGDGKKITINDLNFLFENETANTSGDLIFSADNVLLNLSLNSKKISQSTLTHFVDDLFSSLNKLVTHDESADIEKQSFTKNVTGAIKVEADEFLFAETIKEEKSESYKLTPLKGIIDFEEHGTTLYLTDSEFCGLDINGILNWKKDDNYKEFTLHSAEDKNHRIEDFLACAGVKTKLVNGPFAVKATLFDKNGNLTSGKLHLISRKGVLTEMVLLSKIFKLINFTDLYRGMFSKGLRYDELEVKGHVKNNTFIIDKAYINAEGLDVLAQGTIDLHTLEADLTLFVVPFKTIDKILNLVPLVGRIVGGKKRHLLTYPVRVTGNIKEPTIDKLSASAIGMATINFIFDTITFPLDYLPGSSKEDENDDFDLKLDVPEDNTKE